ncbi:MAG TPA: hypothetical protein VKZ44_07115 [Taishania sp.]|nr:hypothetical protein [Taishania sp.]
MKIIFFLLLSLISTISFSQDTTEFSSILWKLDTLGNNGYRESVATFKNFNQNWNGNDAVFMDSLLGKPDFELNTENGFCCFYSINCFGSYCQEALQQMRQGKEGDLNNNMMSSRLVIVFNERKKVDSISIIHF